MPGPLQYGPGVKAYVVHLLIAQMLSLKRVAQSMHALIGQLLSEATLLGYIAALHHALAEWERHAIERLLGAPAMHVDETSLRVDRNNHWIHVYSAGPLTVKRLHRKRGREAIGIIPRDGGVAVHDCWASYLSYAHCDHHIDIEHCGVCGGTLGVIACIETPELIEKILTHLGAIVKSGVRRVVHAAALLSSMSSIPSLNWTPSMTFASCRNPRSRRQDFSAHRPIL